MTAGLKTIQDVRASAPEGPSLHRGRHFDRLPDRAEARRRLREINDGVCRFSPQAPREPLVLYGAGDLGRLARDYLKTVGQDFALVVDRNAARLRDDPFWAGVDLATPADVPAALKAGALLVVCIATVPFCHVEADLAGDGWRDIVPFYDLAESWRHRHPLSNGWFADRLTSAELEATEQVLDGFADDVSRAHHLQFLAWRRLREEWTFDGAPVTRDDRFFIPEVMRHIDRVRVFLDGGAHHGAVTARFASRAAATFASIVAVEPDDDSSARFRRMQSALPDDVAGRIVLLPHALDAERRARVFHAGLGYASQLSETGRHAVETRTLDNLGLAPDFVKLHLEGGELDALRGGLETIRRNRPILALTTYHNADGIFKTPAWLMEQLEDYRILMRLHGWCGTGSVVYALPKEHG